MTQEKAIQEAKTILDKYFKPRAYDVREAMEMGRGILYFEEDVLKAMLEYASSSSEKGDGCAQTKYGHNLDVLHLGGCTKCGGTHLKQTSEAHKSSKQFSLDKDFDKWIADNRYEWIRAQRGHFMWYKRFEGSLSGVIGKTTSEIYNEYKSLAPKEHSEGEAKCKSCGANKNEYDECTNCNSGEVL